MRKPSAIFHMLRYGFMYGFLLAMIYLWIGIVVAAVDGTETPPILSTVLPTAFLSLLLGALPGAFFGFIDGCVLSLLVSQIRISTDVRRALSYLASGTLTLTGMSFLILLFGNIFSSPDFSLFSRHWNMLWYILPVPIATFASLYAVHRYFLKLRTWEGVGKAKNKAKHGLTNQLAYDDAAEDSGFMLSQDVAHQQMQDKQ